MVKIIIAAVVVVVAAIAAALCYDKSKLWLYHRNG